MLSGGLDSSVTLSIALKKGFEAHCISFNYKQRHSSEIALAKFQARNQNAKSHKIIKIDFLGVLHLLTIFLYQEIKTLKIFQILFQKHMFQVEILFSCLMQLVSRSI